MDGMTPKAADNDQLFPLGRVATTLGDVVITLYVIELGWVMIDRLKQRKHIDKKH